MLLVTILLCVINADLGCLGECHYDVVVFDSVCECPPDYYGADCSLYIPSSDDTSAFYFM